MSNFKDGNRIIVTKSHFVYMTQLGNKEVEYTKGMLGTFKNPSIYGGNVLLDNGDYVYLYTDNNKEMELYREENKPAVKKGGSEGWGF